MGGGEDRTNTDQQIFYTFIYISEKKNTEEICISLMNEWMSLRMALDVFEQKHLRDDDDF